MSEDPSSSDSDVEYHTCDEESDDGHVHRAGSQSSSSSDDGRDYYHTSDDDDEDDDDEDDVLATAPLVSVKKETHQLYTSNIRGLDRQVQDILESCGQPEQIQQHILTSGSRQDDDELAVSTTHMRQCVPISRSVTGSKSREAMSTSGSQQDEGTLTLAGSRSTEPITATGFQQDKNTLAAALSHNRDMLPTDDNFSSSGAAGGYNALVQLNVNVTQQQFGDVTVENATNINQSFGGSQHISKNATFQENGKDAELSRSDKIMKRTVEHFEAWNQGMVKTAALEKVLDKLEAGASWLTVKGNPGEGKTTVGFMALEELYKRGREVFEVRSQEEFSEVISTCPRPVIMLDDVFGNLEFDQSKWSSWEPAISPLLRKREHRSHEEEDTTQIKDVTVLLVGRDYVLNSASRDLGRLSDFLKSDKYVVYMGHSLTRNMEEKRAIWNSISKSSGVHLDKSTIDEILKINVAHGFPHVCRLYVTLYKENKEIKAKEFFEKPLEFLNCSVENLFKDATKLELLKEMVKKEKISMRELRRLDPTYKLIQAAKSMVGSFLRIEDDTVLFDHPSIYDSVAFQLCLLDPVFVIQQCCLAFIHERVRLQMSQNSPSTTSSESSLVVNVDSSYSDELAERFSSEIMKQNFYYVLSHQAFTDGSFVSKVMSRVAIPFSKLVRLRDQNNIKNSFLHLVPSSKSPELLKYLDKCTDVQLDGDDETIIFGTCQHAALNVLTYLRSTRKLLNINVRFKSGCTPLIIAAQTGDVQFIHQILSLNPDVNVCDRNGRTALHWLCINGLVSLVTQIIDGGAHIDAEDWSNEYTPLCLACESNHLGVVKLLISRGAKVDGNTLKSACIGGNIDIVKLLLEKEPSLNDKKILERSLRHACKGGSVDVLKCLVHKGASVNTSTSFLYLLANVCISNKPHALKWLLQQITDGGIQDKSETLLRTAATVNLRVKNGSVALHPAAMWGARECVDLLLKAGADVNARTIYGETALHKAAGCGQEECVDLLLAAGADVNIQNDFGDTALDKAAQSRSKKCVEVLQTAGAVFNIQ